MQSQIVLNIENSLHAFWTCGPMHGSNKVSLELREAVVVSKAATQIVQGGAPELAKLVYNSNDYGLWYL